LRKTAAGISRRHDVQATRRAVALIRT
jgi:hypothetical protein